MIQSCSKLTPAIPPGCNSAARSAARPHCFGKTEFIRKAPSHPFLANIQIESRFCRKRSEILSLLGGSQVGTEESSRCVSFRSVGHGKFALWGHFLHVPPWNGAGYGMTVPGEALLGTGCAAGGKQSGGSGRGGQWDLRGSNSHLPSSVRQVALPME